MPFSHLNLTEDFPADADRPFMFYTATQIDAIFVSLLYFSFFYSFVCGALSRNGSSLMANKSNWRSCRFFHWKKIQKRSNVTLCCQRVTTWPFQLSYAAKTICWSVIVQSASFEIGCRRQLLLRISWSRCSWGNIQSHCNFSETPVTFSTFISTTRYSEGLPFYSTIVL